MTNMNNGSSKPNQIDQQLDQRDPIRKFPRDCNGRPIAPSSRGYYSRFFCYSEKGLMMKMMTMTRKSPVVNGLRDISVGEFWRNPLLPAETLQEKLNGIPVDGKLFPELSEEIQLIQELLFAYGSRRYGAISLLAMVDILQAADYFLVLQDANPDSRENGYADDAEIVHRAVVKHEAELRAFKEWLRAQ
jgi:hypothetical protein